MYKYGAIGSHGAKKTRNTGQDLTIALIVFLIITWSFSDLIPKSSSIRIIVVLLVDFLLVVESFRMRSKTAIGASMIFWVLFLVYIVVDNGVGVNAPYDLSNMSQAIYGFWWYISILALLLFAFLAANQNRLFRNRILRTIGIAMIVFGTIHAVATIFFFLFPSVYARVFQPMVYGSVLPYPFGYQSGLCVHYTRNAMNITAGLIAAMCLYMSMEKSRRGRNRLLLACIALFVALLLTSKRAHFVFAVLTCLIIYIIWNRHRLTRTAILLIVFIIVGGIFLFTLVSLVPELSVTFSRLDQLTEDTTFGGRKYFYDICGSMYASNEAFGCGYGSFMSTIESTKRGAGLATGDSMFLQAHNQYLQTLAEEGMVGFILFFCAMMICLIVSLRNLLKADAKSNKLTSATILLSIGCQIFTIMYGFTGSTMTMYFSYYVYFIALIPAFIKRDSLEKGL